MAEVAVPAGYLVNHALKTALALHTLMTPAVGSNGTSTP